MQCMIQNSLYADINGKVGSIDTDNICGNGLYEVLVDGARYVVATHEVTVLPDLRDSVAVNELPY